jgi:protein-tyrosine-phosphatase
VKKVLFVCTANTFCGPMAEAIPDTLAEDEGLRFRAEGAATEALEGTAIAEKAVAALEEAGIYPGLHGARG